MPEGAARDALFQRLVDEQYAKGNAINMAATLEIDAVIDPADTAGSPGLESARCPSRAALHRPVVGASGQWRACSAGWAAS